MSQGEKFTLEHRAHSRHIDRVMAAESNSPERPRRYVWPWYAAAALALGVLIAIQSVRKEAQRLHERKQFLAPVPEASQP